VGIDPQTLVTTAKVVVFGGFGGPLVQKALGPLIDGFGDALRQRFQPRLDKIAGKAEEMIASAAIEPSPIPDAIGYPLLQSAALEDDPTLQEKWAALLANAADPANRDWIRPLFVDILKQISPLEVKLLDGLFEALIEAVKKRNMWGSLNAASGTSPRNS
jgi:hypothetical protein